MERKLKFGETLRRLRLKQQDNRGKQLSLRALADRANVNFSLISGIETGARNGGEISLRKLAEALALEMEEAEAFVEEGLSAAGSNQVMDEFKEFPTAFLHVLGREIMSAFPDMNPGQIEDVQWRGGGLKSSEADLVWRVGDKWFAAEVSVACGSSPSNAFTKLRRKHSQSENK